MATWTNLYINSDKTQAIIEKLASLTDDLVITPNTEFPRDIGEFQMLNTELAPNYIAVGNTQKDWTTVVHNSFAKMENWGILFSKEFSCKVIVTIAQSVSSVYYFALYDNGQKLREIETCYSDDSDEINFGERFEFENADATEEGETDEGGFYFDFDNIEEYCRHFNLTIQTDYKAVKWTVLKGKNLKSEIAEYVQKLITKKPWWKFW